MNSRSISITVVIAALALTAFAGCYTKLMPFREAVQLRRAAMSPTSGGTTAGGINYSDNCLTCHSEAELNDRTLEVNSEEFYAIHGIPYDPYGWQNPYVQPPWWEPNYHLEFHTGAWHSADRVPVITTGGGSTNAQTKNPNRVRDSGPQREGDTPRKPRPRPTSEPRPAVEPTTASPTQSSPMPSSPPPTTSTTVPVISTPPAQTPPPQQTDTRTRSNGSEDSRTRRSGSGRE